MIIFGANAKAIRNLAKPNEIEDNVIVGVKSGEERVHENGYWICRPKPI